MFYCYVDGRGGWVIEIKAVCFFLSIQSWKAHTISFGLSFLKNAIINVSAGWNPRKWFASYSYIVTNERSVFLWDVETP